MTVLKDSTEQIWSSLFHEVFYKSSFFYDCRHVKLVAQGPNPARKDIFLTIEMISYLYYNWLSDKRQ